MKYLKLYENGGITRVQDELNSTSKNIDVVLIPSGEVLSVIKEKLFLIFENDPEFEINWNEEIQKFVSIDENKEEILELLEVDWDNFNW